MFSIHFSKLKCDYRMETYEAIFRYGRLCSELNTFDRTAILDDDCYHVRDVGRSIGQMRKYELDTMLAKGVSFANSEFAAAGPHLVHVKKTDEYFYVVGGPRFYEKGASYLCNKHGDNRRLIRDERRNAL